LPGRGSKRDVTRTFLFCFIFSFHFTNDIILLRIAYNRTDRDRRIVNRWGRTSGSAGTALGVEW
jgi:hypothetical protein